MSTSTLPIFSEYLSDFVGGSSVDVPGFLRQLSFDVSAARGDGGREVYREVVLQTTNEAFLREWLAARLPDADAGSLVVEAEGGGRFDLDLFGYLREVRRAYEEAGEDGPAQFGGIYVREDVEEGQ